jgi:FdhD protein
MTRQAGKPLLTQAARPATRAVTALNELGQEVATPISGEHPLTLYLDKREIVTLMTLGQAPEALTLGYLRNQRIVRDIAQVDAVQVDWETDCVVVTSTRRAQDQGEFWDDPVLEERMSHRTVTTGCGQGTVFGDLMEEIDSLHLPHAVLTQAVLYEVMDRVRKHESIYKVSGAVHGCALVSNAGESRGEIRYFVEDVGRHNAVDAIAGMMWLDGVSGQDHLFYTTGRLTSEMVIKCAQMQIPILLSRSGVTQMGYDIAQRIGMTMVGRCQGKHYLLFTGAQRFVAEPAGALLA